jgi:hypothetical protein
VEAWLRPSGMVPFCRRLEPKWTGAGVGTPD